MAAANWLLLLASASREEAFLPFACALAASVVAFLAARAVALISLSSSTLRSATLVLRLLDIGMCGVEPGRLSAKVTRLSVREESGTAVVMTDSPGATVAIASSAAASADELLETAGRRLNTSRKVAKGSGCGCSSRRGRDVGGVPPRSRKTRRPIGKGTGGLGSKFGQHFPPIRCETDDAVLSEEVRI